MATFKPSLTSNTELWLLTHQWLQKLRIPVNRAFCRTEISTHPDYPAMTAVTDFLEAGNMQYNAVQADASYIREFNYPLLAHIKQPGRQYMHLLEHASQWDIEKDITKNWTGIVLYPVAGSKWQNKENDAFRLREQHSMLRYTAAILFTCVLFVFLIYKNPNPLYAIMGLLSIAGIILSTWIMGTELGVQNSIVKQVCGAVGKGGCDKVLKTNYAYGFAGLTTGDLALIYFATQFATIIGTVVFPAMFNAMLLVSLTGSLVAAWSIYTQAVTLKQWCALCLGIVAVLLLQFVLAVYIVANIAVIVTMFNWQAMASVAALAFLIILIVQPLKQLLTDNYANAQKLVELKKWKSDAGLFMMQLDKEQEVITTIWENDLIIGNVESTIRITVACNPYCGPCANAHKQLDKLIARYPEKAYVVIRFLCEPDKGADIKTIAVKAILQQAERIKDNSILQLMLRDWFEIMNYEKWSQKWVVGKNADVEAVMQNHKAWIDESGVTHTPTFFINGRKLPGRYILDDVEKMVPELSEKFQEYVK